MCLQDGIRPMWEDDQNKRGGRWLVNMNKNQRLSDLDNVWQEIVRIFFLLTFFFASFCPFIEEYCVESYYMYMYDDRWLIFYEMQNDNRN